MSYHAIKTVPDNTRPAATAKRGNYLIDNRPKTPLQLKLQEGIIQKKTNNTGLPDNLKAGIENLSGHSMDDVKVHYNSSRPAQLQAHAYAQGSQIHIAPGQEKHLPHEAWHVVQQKQGRVRPTLQMKGKVNVNNDAGLEQEADNMGQKALQMTGAEGQAVTTFANIPNKQSALVQLRRIDVVVTGITHLVKMSGKSIMNGVKDREIPHGTEIAIDNADKRRSRRGPNQEIFKGEDSHAGHNYRWFKVLNIGLEDVSAQNLYIRDQTFQTENREPISARQAAVDPPRRLRDPHQDPSAFAGYFPRKQSEMPAVFSSSVRQHVVKQWVQTKLRGVIAVREDKGNKGKNNKGVFKVITKHGVFVVKVAVAADVRTFLAEIAKKDEIRVGLGDEIRYFTQIIDQEQNWHGLALGLYPEAPGTTVGESFARFKAGALTSEEIIHIYHRVVTVLSNFNLKNEKEIYTNDLARTMARTDGGLRAHTDANPDNILVHHDVSFIDNGGVVVNATPYNVATDVGSLIELFKPEIGAAAGREHKVTPGAGKSQTIMDTVVHILENIKKIYIRQIKNKRIKDLIAEKCQGQLNAIKHEFNKNKQ